MKKFTQREKYRAEKKVQIAIDKMIDLKNMGFGCEKTERALEILRSLETNINQQEEV